MSATVKLRPISVRDYLASEEVSEVKHEFVDGYVLAMVGASQRHNLIAGSLFSLLRAHLRGTPCRVFMSDLKVRVKDNFYYPDLVVSCEITDTAELIVPNPRLILEILSPSTEARDRFEKRLAYQCLASLHEYVLVAQDRPHIDVFRRQPDGWEVETYGPHETVSFNTVKFTVAMDLIYEDIRDFTESSGE